GGRPSRAQMIRLAPARAAEAGMAGGFVRMAAAGTVVVMDAGPPPPARAALAAHASTLAMAVSDGPHLLIAGCGGAFAHGPEGMVPRPLGDELADGLRATAAHCALVLDDTNSTRLKMGGTRRSGGVEEVLLDCRMGAEGQWVEARHDGYRGRFGFDHVRRLWLSRDGRDLRGEDSLVPAGVRRLTRGGDVPVAIRFHLGPGAVLSPTGDGRGALIRMAGARPKDAVAWSFRAQLGEGGRLLIEPSLCITADGEAKATQQIVLSGRAKSGAPLAIAWAFARQTRET
ncbi:MAG: heparinase II/III-family protein, partial [Sphingomonadaceae bacterium]